jgi:hypothetical protein
VNEEDAWPDGKEWDPPLGRVSFTVIFGRAILFDNRFGHQWNDFTHVRMDNRRAQHLVIIGARTVSVDLV